METVSSEFSNSRRDDHNSHEKPSQTTKNVSLSQILDPVTGLNSIMNALNTQKNCNNGKISEDVAFGIFKFRPRP